MGNGAKIHITGRGGWNPMHVAAGYGRVSFVEWLFDVGARDMMRAKNCDGDTPLDLAIMNCRDDVIQFLLQGYKNMLQKYDCGARGRVLLALAAPHSGLEAL